MRPGPAFLTLWLSLLAGFAVMAGFAAAYDRFPADLWLAHRLQEIDSAAFERALDWAEDIADTPWIVVVWLAAVAALFAAARRWEALLALLILPISLINPGVKALVDRPRPSSDLVIVREHPPDSAFPSGHADSAILLYGLLFYFITRFVRQPVLRLLGQAACLWTVLFTGMERVYMGAHWPSDVLGGYYLGGLVLTGCIALQGLVLSRGGGK